MARLYFEFSAKNILVLSGSVFWKKVFLSSQFSLIVHAEKDQFWNFRTVSTNFLHLKNTVTTWCWFSFPYLQVHRLTSLPEISLGGCQTESKWRHACHVRQTLAGKTSTPYPEKTKLWNDTRTPVFHSALFTTGKTQKQPTCPWAEQGAKKMWCLYRERPSQA